MKVEALELGYYGRQRRRPGVHFNLEKAEHFSERWMEPIGWDPKAPEKKVLPPVETKKAPPKKVEKPAKVEPKEDEEVI
jgi:hypothetical protein